MYAVILTGGKQMTVKPGDVVEIEKINGEPDTEVTFREVLAVGGEDGTLNVGTPRVAGATVVGKIKEQFLGSKLIVFKMKRRKGYRRTHGHRQQLTRVEITAINA